MAVEHKPAEETDRLSLLPAELLMDIVEHVDVASHLNFAYLQPATIPTLLRNVVMHKDPWITWHIRSLEIRGSRRFWEDWRPFNLVWLWPRERFDEDAQPLEWTLEDKERAEYMRLFKDIFHPGFDDTCVADQQLDEGYDGILKILLMAICPHLSSVKYILRDEGTRDDSLKWLTSLIEMSHLAGSWAPGLRALREVSIGVRSGTWLDYDRKVNHRPDLLASVLRLPSIDTVYFLGVYDRDGDPPVHRQRRVFESRVLLSPPQRPLAPSKPSVSAATSEVIRTAGTKLTDFCSKHAMPRLNLLRVSCSTERGGWKLLANPAVTCITSICSNSTHFHTPGKSGSTTPTFSSRQTSYDMYTIPDLWQTPAEAALEWIISRLPASMEVLFLGNSAEQSDTEKTEDLLIGHLKSDRFPNFKALFIEDDVVRRDRCDRARCSNHEPPNNLYYQRLIAVGEKRGADVNCTASRPRKRIHSEEDIGLPAAPDYAAALKSLPLDSSIHGSDAREFNVVGGEWRLKGCGNCGECEKCFQAYSEESRKARGKGIET
ncbi:hypothetical protein CMEL01_06395 [Colletotrichum melonis]|uniref:F-box domain-containing protein n=1 Tax=Colletotrichum melonis TaxID=1209925 RepID=A0AAI9U534_9PEZI|nr:hypothetical protein CMEL01_06395 [Colletotrichum melonis]